MKKITRQRLGIPIPKTMLLPSMALRRVTSKSGKGVYASGDTLFKGAVFGRDSIEVAEDLLHYKPRLVRRIILTLASLQGEVSDNIREEDLGKIIHEYRTAVVDGRPLDSASRQIFDQLSAQWGGTGKEIAYYGSVDATPHFIRLVESYCHTYGPKLLHQQVKLRSGQHLELSIVLERALTWLVQALDASASGLLEFQRRNPHGLLNQVWKDSNEFYVHENGEIANHDRPIASIELQGLAYDALLAAASLFPDKAKPLIDHAHRLRRRTIDLLWQPERHYFALGYDYSADGKRRIIQTPSANPAALLDTRFFDDLPETERIQLVSGIVRRIMSPDFLTDAGIRSRSLSQSKLIPHWDYHGSYVSWPKETYDIAKGLRRQGFVRLAWQLENRLINVVLKNREYPEFLYVDDWGRVLASSPSPHTHGEVTLVDSTNNPERLQTWTVSAVIAILGIRLRTKINGHPANHRQQWQRDLEKHLLTHIPRVKRIINPLTLSARYPTYPYRLTRDS